ncbi:RNA recognition motif domain-containing protein [Hirschfeldia incana]|nr:RNA recognition motif domain-containing protein [Hirschfeldia incana]
MESTESEYMCFVRGLAWAIDEQSLGRTFSEFGEVLDSKIIIDRETGRSKGFGFVTFKDEESMRTAIERMSGHELDGQNITVNEAQARSSRGGDGGGYSRGGGGGGYGGGSSYGSGGGGYGSRRD